MEMKKPTIKINERELNDLFHELGDEFIVINNPNYVYSKFDICPLAPKINQKRDKIVAVVQDMDGTRKSLPNAFD